MASKSKQGSARNTARKKTSAAQTREVSAAASAAAAESGELAVTGIVRYPNDTPAVGLTVVAFDRDDPGENRLGQSLTDAKGIYRIAYAPAQYQRSGNERGGADLLIRVHDQDGKALAESKVLRNAPPEARIDVTLPLARFVVKGAAKYPGDISAAGLRVVALDKDLRTEQELGWQTTDANGGYRIEYTADQFQRAEKRSADLIVRVFAAGAEGSPTLAESTVLFNALPEVEINFEIPAPLETRSEIERYIEAIAPLLIGQGPDGRDLHLAALTDTDIDFIAGDTGIDRQHIVWLSHAALCDLRTRNGGFEVQSHHLPVEGSSVIPAAAFYGWFRFGMPMNLSELWTHSVPRLIEVQTQAIDRNIVPEFLRGFLADLARAIHEVAIDDVLRPSEEGRAGSLGDLLATLPEPLPTEKVRAVAEVMREPTVTDAELIRRLKKEGFAADEIARVRFTRDLGEVTGNHIPLVRELQRFGGGIDGSVRALASIDPSDWLDLAATHGSPERMPGSPDLYAEQLERAVEAKHPTAVFAARVQGGRVELSDPAFNGAVDFLIENPTLELRDQHARTFVENRDLPDHIDKEQLIERLQRIQCAQSLTNGWRETGSLLNSGFTSSLDIAQQKYETFAQIVGTTIPAQRIADIHRNAQQTHDTTIALFTSTYVNLFSLLGLTFFSNPQQTPTPDALRRYPNLQTLFGNLTTCFCEHCQSVLSPAAYLVDLLRFLDAPAGVASSAGFPLEVLLRRRPDIADLELTCKNTQTQIPYVDLVLEVLENAIGLPIDVPGPYGFDPAEDFGQSPLPANVADALRRVLEHSAITVDEKLEVRPAERQWLIGTLFEWLVTDGARHWVLRHYPYSLTLWRGFIPRKLSVDDHEQAIAALGQGQLPEEWLIPADGSVWNKHLPLRDAPAIEEIVAGRQWKVQYTRAVRVTIADEPPLSVIQPPTSRLILTSIAGALLYRSKQYSSSMFNVLRSALNAGTIAEPLVGVLPSQLSYRVTSLGGGEWEVFTSDEVKIAYTPLRLQVAALTYQTSSSHEDLKATPENLNPEAYKRLDGAVYPWTLPFNLWLHEVRVFLDRRGISRRDLMEQSNPRRRLAEDQVADAIAREVLGLSLSEAKIIDGSDARQPWEYWGLEQNGNSVADLNDPTVHPQGLVSGSWTEVLSFVSILMQRSGLSYRELLNVLQTRFVQVPANARLPFGDACNPSKMVVILSVDHLNRIHRLVRLWRKLGGSIFEIDRAIEAVTAGSMALNATTLRGLAHLIRVHELLGMRIGEVASWWGGFTASYSDYTAETPLAIRSLYERLFLNAAIVNPPDRDFVLNARATELEYLTGQNPKALANKAVVIAATLGITQAELDLFIADLSDQQELDGAGPDLNLHNLAALFRHVSLAKALRLPIRSYLLVKSLVDIQPFASTARAVEFVECMQFIRASGFTIEALDYLLRYTLDAEPTPFLSMDWLSQTLTSLRSSLQNVQREVLQSAEPAAEHLRKVLVRVGWFDDLIETAVRLFTTEGRLQVTLSGNPAPAVTIPQALTGKIAYDRDTGTLAGSLTLTAAEWSDLAAANSGAAVQGIRDLRIKVDAFAAILARELPQLQSFELPIHSVSYDPQQAPAIPAELSSRCYFDPVLKQLTFKGWMTDEQETRLRNSLPVADASSVSDLKLAANVPEQENHNRFLFDIDAVKAFFAPGSDANSRVAAVLARALPYLLRKEVAERLSQVLDLDESLLDDLLSTKLDNGATLETLLDADFVGSDSRIKLVLDTYPAQFLALCKVHKAALVCRTLRISASELGWLPPDSMRTFLVLNLNDLPVERGDSAASFGLWQQLVRLFQLRDAQQIGSTNIRRLQLVLNVNRFTDVKTDVGRHQRYLAQVLDASIEDIVWAAARADLQTLTDYSDADKLKDLALQLLRVHLARALQVSRDDVAEVLNHLGLGSLDDCLNTENLTALYALLASIQRLGIQAAEAFTLVEDVAATGQDLAKPGKAEAALARKLLRARYDEQSWPTQLKPIVDELREKRRQALVSYLITRPPQSNAVNRGRWKDANDLYDHFLIDVEMSPCKVSTRVLHAISAVQLFVQRCLMNIEEDVSPAAIDAERWKWMKNYRVWEANRKVFLYPENWIEPELRDDKSEIFEELEGQLLQDELDDERAEQIVKGYLQQLEQIARLTIVGMYVEKLAQVSGSAETRIHIVGRTRNRPSRFFYRRWLLSAATNRWEPWEHVPLDGVKSDHVLPFVMRGDVYIAWPEITQLAAEPGVGDQSAPGAKWRMQMAWVRKTSRGWGDRFMSGEFIEHPWVYGKDENQTFTFRVREDSAGFTDIDCYGAKRDGELLYSVPSTAEVPAYRATPIPPRSATALNIRVSGVVYGSYAGANSKVYRPLAGARVRVSFELGGTPTEKANAQADLDRDLERDFAGYPNIDEVITTTNADGTFNVNLVLAAQQRDENAFSHSIGYFEKRVIEGRPTIELEISSGDKKPTPPIKIFEYLDPDSNEIYQYYTEERFYQNVIIEIGGAPPSSDASRPVELTPLKTFRIFAADDAEFVSPTTRLLEVPANALSHGSGYKVTGGSTLAIAGDAGSSVTVWTGVDSSYSLLPAAPFEPRAAEVCVYQDTNNSYFIRREGSSADAAGTQGKYQILVDGHPKARDLRRDVSIGGLPKLFDLSQQGWQDAASFGNHTPGTLVDADRSLTRPAIRFDPEEAHSPYASYNAELFFHVPFLIATFLSASQRFAEALRWFHFTFDPTTDDPATGNQRYWRYLPFRRHSITKPIDELLKVLGDPSVPSTDADKERIATQIDVWSRNPFRPHTVARLRPRAYEFAVTFKYLDNLIAWGDHLFRQYTTESINEATQLYILAAKLLGQRPQNIPRRAKASPLTYRKVAGNWDSFANAWVEVEANVSRSWGYTTDSSPVKYMAGTHQGTTSLSSLGMLYFCIPANQKILEYWDKIDNRLFNIRHCRNIDGIEQEVPLWQPPIDPALLVRAAAAGLDLGTVLSDASTPLPYYRFSALAQKASELCNEVKAFGASLLSALEKKDAEQLSLLRSSQEVELLNLVQAVKQGQLDEANANIEALKQSEQLSTARFVQYQRLLGKNSAQVPDDEGADVEQTSMVRVANPGDSSSLGLTQAEYDQFTWSDVALAMGTVASTHSIISGILYAVPDVSVGTPWINSKFGGTNLGSILSAGSAFWSGLDRIATHHATRSAAMGGYQRRQDEWVFQSRLALKEIQQIRKQILAATIRRDVASKELDNHRQQIKNAQETDRFMREKYTNRELYQWMTQQVSSVYFRAYQLAFDVAKRAEQGFRFELGLTDSKYIQFGYWDSLKKGLFAGEKLGHDLKRMEVAYLDQNRREYEIVKHVSLLSLDPQALIALRETGRCEIAIPEVLFDLDHPGHYLRRIRTLSVTIPCVTGPYASVNCTVTLLKSSVRRTPDIAGGYARIEGDSRFVDSFGAVQSVVISSAQNDSGLFETNLRDERYLPFEGAGAISMWRLELPDQFRAFDYKTISDVIFHIRYTARNGGESLKTRARTELQSALDTIVRVGDDTGLVRLFSLKQEFPSEWHRLKNATNSTGAAVVQFPIAKNRFPFMFGNRGVNITLAKLRLYAVPAAAADLQAFPSWLQVFVPGQSSAVSLADTTAIGTVVGKKSTADLGVPVSDSETASIWKLEVPAANLTEFRNRVDDILLACDYVAAIVR